MAIRDSHYLSSYLADSPTLSGTLEEGAFLREWNDDVKRAARAAASGDHAYEEDLAQQARLRLLVTNRAFPSAPIPYVRTVIANAMRTSRRRPANGFSTRSPLAQELDDEIEAPTKEHDDGRGRIVATWVQRLPTQLRDLYHHLYTEERSQRAASALMKVSQPRVAQLHRQLLKRGRQDLAHLAS